jgi:hypothetical protein
VGWFLFFRGQGQQQPKQNGRRLISLIFAGRNRRPGAGILSQTPTCLIQLLHCDQVSDRVKLSFRIFFGQFRYSVDVCAHNDSSSESRYVSFQQIRTPASPYPPVGLVAAPYGSPAVPHFHRYYEVVRLLSHPSVLPSVDPWLHISFKPFEGVPSGVKEMGSSLGFPASLFGNMPWARDTADFSTPSRSGCCRMLPSASGITSASKREPISVLILTACFLTVYASHPPVAR